MGKTTKGKNHPSNIYKLYDVSDGVKRKNQFCPKCGVGVFMSAHKDRNSCGKCGYTEFKKK